MSRIHHNTAIAIAADMSKLQSLLEDSEGGIGELTPEMIEDTMSGLEMTLADKLDSVLVHVRNLEGQEETCDKEIKRLSDRKKSFRNQAKHLKQYILNCLLAANLDKIKTTKNTFTARKGVVNVVIDNESLVPDEFVNLQTIITPDKKAIKEAIESAEAAVVEITARGETPPAELLNPVPGAHIEIGARSLQVR
ncbi:siphovirus Gp157 family protein [Pectobacterium carotovorum]|uniref:siphovirus Gp157 family protein n=1 Tax=Pectobacterium carotovorum TaxID=554 RepID=UPI00057D98A9|nr:siphovirus Gp157 family protein [Pectobacterium carotovorum]KHT34426.1 siphovirus Gp157 family protein [Pectobacterium carotovorum subsp. carotovorum]